MTAPSSTGTPSDLDPFEDGTEWESSYYGLIEITAADEETVHFTPKSGDLAGKVFSAFRSDFEDPEEGDEDGEWKFWLPEGALESDHDEPEAVTPSEIFQQFAGQKVTHDVLDAAQEALQAAGFPGTAEINRAGELVYLEPGTVQGDEATPADDEADRAEHGQTGMPPENAPRIVEERPKGAQHPDNGGQQRIASDEEPHFSTDIGGPEPSEAAFSISGNWPATHDSKVGAQYLLVVYAAQTGGAVKKGKKQLLLEVGQAVEYDYRAHGFNRPMEAVESVLDFQTRPQRDRAIIDHCIAYQLAVLQEIGVTVDDFEAVEERLRAKVYERYNLAVPDETVLEEGEVRTRDLVPGGRYMFPAHRDRDPLAPRALAPHLLTVASVIELDRGRYQVTFEPEEGESIDSREYTGQQTFFGVDALSPAQWADMGLEAPEDVVDGGEDAEDEVEREIAASVQVAGTPPVVTVDPRPDHPGPAGPRPDEPTSDRRPDTVRHRALHLIMSLTPGMTSAPPSERLRKLNREQLTEVCEVLELKTSGKKADLVQRIEDRLQELEDGTPSKAERTDAEQRDELKDF